MQNKLDDASLWWESRHSEIQDHEIPEQEEIPPFIEDTEREPIDYVSDRDVKHELNMTRLNEPTAEIIVSMMDVILPLILVVLIKGTDKQDVKLEESERDTLIAAWAGYLKTTSFNLSPGGILITSILTIYGAKVTVAIMNKKNEISELEVLRKQNTLLKQSLDGKEES